MRAAKAQKDGLFLAYPVFGPLATGDRAYDALRDEFMLDTLKRCMRTQNSVARAAPLSGS